MKASLSFALVLLAAGASQLHGQPLTNDLPPAVATPSQEVTPVINLGQLVAAGTVQDLVAEVRGGGAWTNTWRVIAVREVFWGDPEVRSLRMSEPEKKLSRGERILVSYPGNNIFPRGTVVPDTPANRRAVDAEIRQRQLDTFEQLARGGSLGFIDRAAAADAMEALLKEYLAELSTRLADHPQLGSNALKDVKIVRCQAPVGAYFRIVSNAVWHPTPEPHQLLASDDGFVLWVGVGTGLYTSFTAGSPEYLPDPERVAPEAPAGGAERLSNRGRAFRISLSSPWANMSMNLYAAVHDPDGKGSLLDLIGTRFEAMQPKFTALAMDPPRDLEATIQYLEDHLAEVQRQWSPASQLTNSLLPQATGANEDHRLAAAYHALGCPCAEIGPAATPRKFNAEQRARLVPLLIELLADRTTAINLTPVDGPMILSHELAYLLLVQITDVRLPRPIASEPATSLLPRSSADPPFRQNAPSVVEERLGAWRNWWKTEGKSLGR